MKWRRQALPRIYDTILLPVCQWESSNISESGEGKERGKARLLASSMSGLISTYEIFKHIFSNMLGMITDRLIRKLFQRIASIGDGKTESRLFDHGGIVVAIAHRDHVCQTWLLTSFSP